MRVEESMELIKKYGVCPECGNDRTGGEPSQGVLHIENDTFTRSCKCGWSITVDRRIKHIGTLTRRKGSKLVGGVYEVRIHGQFGHKYLPLLELKEKSGVKRIDHTKKIDEWLNTPAGRDWALTVPVASIDD